MWNAVLIIFAVYIVNIIFTYLFYNQLMKLISHKNEIRCSDNLHHKELMLWIGWLGLLFRKKLQKKNIISYYEYLIESHRIYGTWSKSVIGIVITDEDCLNAKRILKLNNLKEKRCLC